MYEKRFGTNAPPVADLAGAHREIGRGVMPAAATTTPFAASPPTDHRSPNQMAVPLQGSAQVQVQGAQPPQTPGGQPPATPSP
jgi:hypothetical protein